jgi:cell division GTPase FtsZ
MTLMRSDVEGPTSEAAQPDPLANLLAHLRTCYPESEQLIKEVVNLGWRAVVGSAVARGDGRAERAVREAIAPLLSDGSFRTAQAASVHFFAAYGSREEVDAAMAMIRQAAVPRAEVFNYWLSDPRMGDELEIHVLLYAFADELEALASGADP